MTEQTQDTGLRLLPSGQSPHPNPRKQVGGLSAEVLALPVLIVEDEGVIAWTLESLLEELGFSAIAIAADGAEALKLAKQTAPGLIVSDINLGPGALDGVAAAAAIVADTRAPVVFISGFASADARQRIAEDVPKAALLRKPINVVELREAIVAVTGRRSDN